MPGDASAWDAAIQRFREVTPRTDATRTYIELLEGARARWGSLVVIHPWRLDILHLTAKTPSELAVQAEYRVRYSGFVDGELHDGQPIVVFRLGPGRHSIDVGPVIAGDICRPETAPAVLDAFLSQIASAGSQA
jgi:hypothetical protein